MTKQEADEKLKKAIGLVFEVESEMDVRKSKVRHFGFRARIELATFQEVLRKQPEAVSIAGY